jgi:uncharacterized protein YjlB
LPLKDQVKNFARKMVEDRPDAAAARLLVQRRAPQARRFADDGIVPNHPRWSLIIYRKAIRFTRTYEAAPIIDALFEANGWGRSWRDSVYDFVHYHSQVHEVLGVARGHGLVEFGGLKGRRLLLSAGDIAILPAGTGHRLLKATKDFLVVGAYPASGAYDECTDTRDRVRAIKRIASVGKPKTDPVYGKDGPLVRLWRVRARKRATTTRQR